MLRLGKFTWKLVKEKVYVHNVIQEENIIILHDELDAHITEDDVTCAISRMAKLPYWTIDLMTT